MRFSAALMGVNFRPAEVREFVKDSETFESYPLTLEREPDNQYDANAIRVIADVGYPEHRDTQFVGFVAKEVAEELAPLLDSGYAVDSVRVITWLGTIKPLLEIEVSLPEDEYADEAPDSTYEQG